MKLDEGEAPTPTKLKAPPKSESKSGMPPKAPKLKFDNRSLEERMPFSSTYKIKKPRDLEVRRNVVVMLCIRAV